MKRLFAAVLAWMAFAAWADVLPLQLSPLGSITISATNSSAATALPVTSISPTVRQLEIQNAGTVTVFVEPGISTTTATTAASYPVLAGQSKVITIGAGITYVAVIATSGTQTVYVTVGSGQ